MHATDLVSVCMYYLQVQMASAGDEISVQRIALIHQAHTNTPRDGYARACRCMCMFAALVSIRMCIRSGHCGMTKKRDWQYRKLCTNAVCGSCASWLSSMHARACAPANASLVLKSPSIASTVGTVRCCMHEYTILPSCLCYRIKIKMKTCRQPHTLMKCDA